MSRAVKWLDQRFYPDSVDRWDDVLFRDTIVRHLKPEHTILDLGAGSGRIQELAFRGQVARVCGIDLDERVVDNPLLDEGKVAGGESIPYPDASFDVVFSDNVLEHLEQPEAVFREVARVLRPNGVFLVKTPNFYHYMPLIASATPLWFHRAFNRLRNRDSEDTFPTVYRANTPQRLEQLAAAAGLTLEAHHLIEGRPEYLRIHPLTYPVGIAYERLVNRSRRLARLRILLVGEMRKPR